jgi:glycosyltransferase involved in cell wall biosynthesis
MNAYVPGLAPATVDARPLVVHLVHSLSIGGMEVLLVDCINRMPAESYRHAVVCLTAYSTFADNISRPDVELYALGKPPGLGLATHLKFWRLMRRLRPTVLHTYNLSALEYAFTATMAGVPVRIHAEHGRDASDPQGLNPKHNFLRRRLVPFVDRFVPVSDDLERWLGEVVRIPRVKTLFIKNGVDNHACLVEAFARLRALLPDLAPRLKLSIVGDGPLLPAVRRQVAELGLQDAVWLPGARSDIKALLHSFSLFALPSLAEGTPVSLLEAMASGLPVVASHVGGIPEVVTNGEHGLLVPVGDADALAQALARYAREPELGLQHGRAGRARVEDRFSMRAMLASYGALYDGLCRQKAPVSSLGKKAKSCVE